MTCPPLNDVLRMLCHGTLNIRQQGLIKIAYDVRRWCCFPCLDRISGVDCNCLGSKLARGPTDVAAVAIVVKQVGAGS